MEVCSHLERENLDPAIIGSHLEYLDNQRSSDVLVVYLACFGMGHSIFEAALDSSPYRGVAVTLYGMEQETRRRIPLPIADHLTILRLFVQHLNETIRPAITIVAGFSSGGDVALRLISEGGLDSNSVTGVLALGPNISLETCFFSHQVANIRDDADGGVFRVVRDLMAGLDSAEAWLLINPYLVEVVRKFQTDLEALRRHGEDIVAFSSSEEEQAPLRGLMLAHLDNEVFGPDFDDSEIVTVPESGHFDLIQTQVIEQNLVKLVNSIRSTAADSAP
jgi:pimeloyl-ACP methyl ester carboxylesterase